MAKRLLILRLVQFVSDGAVLRRHALAVCVRGGGPARVLLLIQALVAGLRRGIRGKRRIFRVARRPVLHRRVLR